MADEHDVPDPDDVRDSEERTRQVFGNFRTYSDVQKYATSLVNLVIALVDAAGGEVRLPADFERRALEDTRLPFFDQGEDECVITLVEHPPSEKAQAVLDGGPDWIHASSGKAVKVTGADGEMVAFVI